MSVVANLAVIATMLLGRSRKGQRSLKSAHLFVLALAISDICFSLAIHPMLAATCFGVQAKQLFTKAGKDISTVPRQKIQCKKYSLRL